MNEEEKQNIENLTKYSCKVIKFLTDKIQIYENESKDKECKSFSATDQN